MQEINGPYLGDLDLHLLSEGRHYRTYEKLGAHPVIYRGVAGTHFAVWAPNAQSVSVIGEFNDWRWDANPMAFDAGPGIWTAFVPGARHGQAYKYAIHSKFNGYNVAKADPHGFFSEVRPKTASRIWSLDGYNWGDQHWMHERAERQALHSPMSIYEVHLGSWMRGENNRWLTYREMAPILVEWLRRESFTHVELLPLNEHPFDGSWGYQSTGYFSATSRFGTPQDLMFLIDSLHQAGIGVILDWVPAHFPGDEHGLTYFDGTHLYEHADPRQGRHRHWNTNIFNFGRREVCNFLISNALFWLDKYHVDGLRVDAVASMLYLDYGRDQGDWVPNRFGGRENLEAIEFLRRFNEQVSEEYPGVITIAEESTAWPLVSRPTTDGGLGFHFKWNMGWMHDMLEYMQTDPLFRPWTHNKLTFSMMYNYSENYVLAFSHDEVVHLKKSMLSKMPGDAWQQFASLRLLYGYMMGHPGKKLLFMGGEFGQWGEWNHDRGLDWGLMHETGNKGMAVWLANLNALYRKHPALSVGDYHPWGFKWITCDDHEQSVVAFLRYDEAQERAFVFVCNFTPVVRHNYRMGVPWRGKWKEVLNSDASTYGGSGVNNGTGVSSEKVAFHEHAHSVVLTLPPLAVIILEAPPRPKPRKPAAKEQGAESDTSKTRSKSTAGAKKKSSKAAKPQG